MIISKLLDLLTYSEKRSAFFVLIMVLIMALFEVAGVASIMPFIAVLTNPDLLQTNLLLKKTYEASAVIGVKNQDDFLFLLGIFVFVLLIVSLLIKTVTIYAQTRFTYLREFSIGKRLVEGYLHQPYQWFLNRHTSDLEKNILSEVNQVVINAFVPTMNLIAQISVAVALLALIILVDPFFAITSGIVLSCAYALMFKSTSGTMKRVSEKRVASNKARFIAASEAFSAIKEIKVGGLEKVYVQRFSEPSEIYAKSQAIASIIGQLPRFALEGVAFGGMLIAVLYLMKKSDDISTVLPVIALYTMAGYRLMPALQQIYGAITQLRYSKQIVDILHNDFLKLQNIKDDEDSALIKFSNQIELKNLYYRYPDSSKPALNGINANISAGSKVGFVGATGSGKTTTIDIILGILEPQDGTLEVDNLVISHANKRSWQRIIGYVPQNIYLTDDSVAKNIAFGISDSEIDQMRVEEVSKIANLHNFVVNDLPHGYQTALGERGIRISGGQRQRIAIARALYHKPKVLILDEATSALDNLTESAVMEAIENVSNHITVIMIAHRLSTVKNCEKIFLLEDGKVAHQGSYEELLNISDKFRLMTKNEI